jgi:hypothetical protein
MVVRVRCRSDASDQSNPRSFLRRKSSQKDMKFNPFKFVLLAIALAILTIGMPILSCSPQLPVISPAPTLTVSSAATTSGFSTAIGVKGAKWGSNVKLSYSGNNFTFVSDGIPNHPRPAEYALPNTPCRNLALGLSMPLPPMWEPTQPSYKTST